jgi:hypothetical protein
VGVFKGVHEGKVLDGVGGRVVRKGLDGIEGIVPRLNSDGVEFNVIGVFEELALIFLEFLNVFELSGEDELQGLLGLLKDNGVFGFIILDLGNGFSDSVDLDSLLQDVLNLVHDHVGFIDISSHDFSSDVLQHCVHLLGLGDVGLVGIFEQALIEGQFSSD